MNKIVGVEDSSVINNGNYELIYDRDFTLNVNGEVYLSNINKNGSLDVNINNNSNLDFEKVDYVTNNRNINFYVYDDSILNFNWLILNQGINKVSIKVVMAGCKSKCNIKVRIVNKDKDSSLDLVCNGVINKNTLDNELLEDLKGLILEDDTIKISPNIEVDTDQVMANHLVTVGSFNKNDLFYLKCQGIKEVTAKNLLKEGFLWQGFSDEFKKQAQEVINSE